MHGDVIMGVEEEAAVAVKEDENSVAVVEAGSDGFFSSNKGPRETFEDGFLVATTDNAGAEAFPKA